MKALELLNFVSNPALPRGVIQFNNSKTGTTYYRFNGTYIDENGNMQKCVFFLNSKQVETKAVQPALLEFKQIIVDDTEFEVAMSKQKKDSNVTVIALTNFDVEPDEAIQKALNDINTQMIISQSNNLESSINSRKENFKKMLAQDPSIGNIDPRLVNRGNTQQPAVTTFKEGAISNPDSSTQAAGLQGSKDTQIRDEGSPRVGEIDPANPQSTAEQLAEQEANAGEETLS